MTATTIGLVAGVLTTIAVVPQVYHSWRTRHVRDLSLWQPVLLVAGMVLWLWYGIELGDQSVVGDDYGDGSVDE